MNTAVIAQHLNITEATIVRIEEWANVLFVVCRRIGARFVSKKLIEAKIMLKNSASFQEMKDHLTAVGIWPEGVRSCSIHGILQSWINSQKWESISLDSLLLEVNQRLTAMGVPASYGVRECWDSIVSHKLEANSHVFTFV